MTEPKALSEEELTALEQELHDFDTNNISPPELEPRGKLGVFRGSSFWHRVIAMARQSLALQRRVGELEKRLALKASVYTQEEQDADRAEVLAYDFEKD